MHSIHNFFINLLTETMSKIPEDILRLTDDQLRQEIVKRNLTAGPITDSTRKAYQNRLLSVWGLGGAAKKAPTKAVPQKSRSPKKQSVAAMSSEEEDEEEEVAPPPPRPTRQATPPTTRKSCALCIYINHLSASNFLKNLQSQ
jgi:LEM domain